MPADAFEPNAFLDDPDCSDQPAPELRNARPRFGAGWIQLQSSDEGSTRTTNPPVQPADDTPPKQPASSAEAIADDDADASAFWCNLEDALPNAALTVVGPLQAEDDLFCEVTPSAALAPGSQTCEALHTCTAQFARPPHDLRDERASQTRPTPSSTPSEVLRPDLDIEALRDLLELSCCGLSVAWPQGVDQRIARLIVDQRLPQGSMSRETPPSSEGA